MGMLDGETFAINLKSNWCVRYSTRAVYRGWCIKITTSSLVKNQQFLHYIDETWAKWLGAFHKGYPTFQLVNRFAKMGYEDI